MWHGANEHTGSRIFLVTLFFAGKDNKREFIYSLVGLENMNFKLCCQTLSILLLVLEKNKSNLHKSNQDFCSFHLMIFKRCPLLQVDHTSTLLSTFVFEVATLTFVRNAQCTIVISLYLEDGMKKKHKWIPTRVLSREIKLWFLYIYIPSTDINFLMEHMVLVVYPWFNVNPENGNRMHPDKIKVFACFELQEPLVLANPQI